MIGLDIIFWCLVLFLFTVFMVVAVGGVYAVITAFVFASKLVKFRRYDEKD